MIKESHESMVKKAASKQGFEMERVVLPEEENQNADIVKPVHLYLTKRLDSETRTELVPGIRKIAHTGLDVHLINDTFEGIIFLN